MNIRGLFKKIQKEIRGFITGYIENHKIIAITLTLVIIVSIFFIDGYCFEKRIYSYYPIKTTYDFKVVLAYHGMSSDVYTISIHDNETGNKYDELIARNGVGFDSTDVIFVNKLKKPVLHYKYIPFKYTRNAYFEIYPGCYVDKVYLPYSFKNSVSPFVAGNYKD